MKKILIIIIGAAAGIIILAGYYIGYIEKKTIHEMISPIESDMISWLPGELQTSSGFMTADCFIRNSKFRISEADISIPEIHIRVPKTYLIERKIKIMIPSLESFPILNSYMVSTGDIDIQLRLGNNCPIDSADFEMHTKSVSLTYMDEKLKLEDVYITLDTKQNNHIKMMINKTSLTYADYVFDLSGFQTVISKTSDKKADFRMNINDLEVNINSDSNGKVQNVNAGLEITFQEKTDVCQLFESMKQSVMMNFKDIFKNTAVKIEGWDVSLDSLLFSDDEMTFDIKGLRHKSKLPDFPTDWLSRHLKSHRTPQSSELYGKLIDYMMNNSHIYSESMIDKIMLEISPQEKISVTDSKFNAVINQKNGVVNFRLAAALNTELVSEGSSSDKLDADISIQNLYITPLNPVIEKIDNLSGLADLALINECIREISAKNPEISSALNISKTSAASDDTFAFHFLWNFKFHMLSPSFDVTDFFTKNKKTQEFSTDFSPYYHTNIFAKTNNNFLEYIKNNWLKDDLSYSYLLELLIVELVDNNILKTENETLIFDYVKDRGVVKLNGETLEKDDDRLPYLPFN